MNGRSGRKVILSTVLALGCLLSNGEPAVMRIVGGTVTGAGGIYLLFACCRHDDDRFEKLFAEIIERL